jgi:hypothetical protein
MIAFFRHQRRQILREYRRGLLSSQTKYNPETARSTGKTSQILREKSVKLTRDDIAYNSSDGIVLYGDSPAFGLKATIFFLLVRLRV